MIRYKIHDLIEIHVEDGAPFDHEMLRHFRASTASPAGLPNRQSPLVHLSVSEDFSCSTAEIVDGPNAGVLTAICSSQGHVHLYSSGSLDHLIMPVADALMIVKRGSTFVHAAAVVHDAGALAIAGAGGIGKTAISRQLVDAGWGFLGDDMTIWTADGDVCSFPRPLYLYPYHKELFPDVFSASKKLLAPVAALSSISRLRKPIRPLLRRFPRVEAWARRHTPEHLRVSPREAMPRVYIPDAARLNRVVLLSREDEPKAHRDLAVNELASELSAYTVREYEEQSLEQASIILQAFGCVASLREAKESVLRETLTESGSRCQALVLPRYLEPRVAATQFSEFVDASGTPK